MVLVGSVDSLCDQSSLIDLARKNRLLGEHNIDGIIPGEGAGFALLAHPDYVRRGNGEPMLWVLECVLAREQRHFLQEKMNLSEGLTQVFRHLRKHPVTGNRRVDYVLSSQTGEGYWAQEFIFAYLRNVALMPEPMVTEMIGESFGDVGAGSGALLLGMSLHRLKELQPAATHPVRSLIYGSSDHGQIGACVVEYQRSA